MKLHLRSTTAFLLLFVAYGQQNLRGQAANQGNGIHRQLFNYKAVPDQVLSYLGYNHAPEAVDTLREQIREEMKNTGALDQEDRFKDVKKMIEKEGQRIFNDAEEENRYRDFRQMRKEIEDQAKGIYRNHHGHNEEEKYLPHGGWLEKAEDVINHIAYDIKRGIHHQNEINEEDRYHNKRGDSLNDEEFRHARDRIAKEVKEIIDDDRINEEDRWRLGKKIEAEAKQVIQTGDQEENYRQARERIVKEAQDFIRDSEDRYRLARDRIVEEVRNIFEDDRLGDPDRHRLARKVQDEAKDIAHRHEVNEEDSYSRARERITKEANDLIRAEADRYRTARDRIVEEVKSTLEDSRIDIDDRYRLAKKVQEEAKDMADNYKQQEEDRYRLAKTRIEDEANRILDRINEENKKMDARTLKQQEHYRAVRSRIEADAKDIIHQASKLDDDERYQLAKKIADEAMDMIREEEANGESNEEDRYVRARQRVETKAKELLSSHHERDLYDSHHEDHHEGHHEDHHEGHKDVDLDLLFGNDERNEEDYYADQKTNQEDKHMIIKTDGTKLDEKDLPVEVANWLRYHHVLPPQEA